MAKKRLTLPKDFADIMERNDPNELEKVFESCNIDAYERDWMRTPALCMYGISEDFIKWMVAHGADINVSDTYGKTPLMQQAQLNQQGRVRLLLHLGADIHAKDDSQQTALHYAKAPETIKILLENGANPCAINNMGETPLMQRLLECRSYDTPRTAEAARLLLDAGDKVNDKMRECVRSIGHEFENSRDGLAPKVLQECEKGMKKLYTLFGIEAVPAIKKHSGNELITVQSTDWADCFEELWDYLVPSEGHAPTVQGEVIRICGKLTREILDNGSCNWSREYKKLPQALPVYFSMGNPIPASAFSSSLQTNQLQDENEELAALAKSIHADSTEEDLYRLTELTVKWVIANPNPIKLKQVNYQR